eukprot:5235335-Alexandrium_andersonii.AAC.1
MTDIKNTRKFFPRGDGKGKKGGSGGWSKGSSRKGSKGKGGKPSKGFAPYGPCLKCGGRHPTRECPDQQPAGQPTAHFVSGLVFMQEPESELPDVANDAYATDTEMQKRGKGLLDCGATDSVGGYQSVEDLMGVATQ